MIREQTVNTFENGIIMDLEPLKVPKSSLTNALNATLLTFNDNENSTFYLKYILLGMFI